MIEFDSSVGGDFSNSYCSVSDANDYHRTLSQDLSDQWDSSDKERMLMWATRLIDQHWKFIGTRVFEDQSLEFPRNNVYRDGIYGQYDDEVFPSTIIPKPIKNATSELARILSTRNTTDLNDKIGLEKIKVGSIEMEMSGNADITDGVFPPSVYDMLSKYGEYIKSLKDVSSTLQVIRLVRG